MLAFSGLYIFHKWSEYISNFEALVIRSYCCCLFGGAGRKPLLDVLEVYLVSSNLELKQLGRGLSDFIWESGDILS